MYSDAMPYFPPNSTIYVTTHQRGSTVRLNISVSRFMDFEMTELNSEPIKAGDWALLVVKCKDKHPGKLSTTDKTDIEVSLRMIKNENTRKCRVQVTCENFSKTISLSEEWVETKILTRGHNAQAYYGPFMLVESSKSRFALLYTIEVNITVLDETSQPMFVNKQLYEDVESTDFQLQTADGTVDVHKAVLSIHSDMFRTMFRGEWKETGEGQIKLDGVTVQTLQHLKDYMYLGTLPDDGLEALLVVAARYMMDKLMEDCSAKLVKTITPENFDDIVELAALNNVGCLVRALIMETPDDVINKVHQLKKNTNK